MLATLARSDRRPAGAGRRTRWRGRAKSRAWPSSPRASRRMPRARRRPPAALGRRRRAEPTLVLPKSRALAAEDRRPTRWPRLPATPDRRRPSRRTRAARGRCLARPAGGLCRGRRFVAAGDLPEGSAEPPRGDPRLPAPRLARRRHAHGDRGSLPRLPHAARRLAHGRTSATASGSPSRCTSGCGACSTTTRHSTRRGSPCSRTAWSASRTCSRPCTRIPATSPTSTGW